MGLVDRDYMRERDDGWLERSLAAAKRSEIDVARGAATLIIAVGLLHVAGCLLPQIVTDGRSLSLSWDYGPFAKLRGRNTVFGLPFFFPVFGALAILLARQKVRGLRPIGVLLLGCAACALVSTDRGVRRHYEFLLSMSGWPVGPATLLKLAALTGLAAAAWLRPPRGRRTTAALLAAAGAACVAFYLFTPLATGANASLPWAEPFHAIPKHESIGAFCVRAVLVVDLAAVALGGAAAACSVFVPRAARLTAWCLVAALCCVPLHAVVVSGWVFSSVGLFASVASLANSIKYACSAFGVLLLLPLGILDVLAFALQLRLGHDA